MQRNEPSVRLKRLSRLAWVAVAVLLAKVFVGILYEYQWYFPANFESSAFLGGRQASFGGLYRAAFYLHIVAGPTCILLGAFLISRAGAERFRRLHSWVGRLQFCLVLALVTPSGLVMATDAYAGPIAGAGFATLSLATSVSIAIAVRHAMVGNLAKHRLWAWRTFLLLCSPLLLRVISGSVIVLDVESVWTYRLNAWVSWLVPCLLFELWIAGRTPRVLQSRSRAGDQALPLFPVAEEVTP